MNKFQLSRFVDMEDPLGIYEETRTIVSLMIPNMSFQALDLAFNDITRLFKGRYPGYLECTTEYHDLKHTTDTFLAMARLIHGGFVQGVELKEREILLGLICALMHDTGYIQTIDDRIGTGAKYLLSDTKRSIAFLRKYIKDNRLPQKDFEGYANILRCTSLESNPGMFMFGSPEEELLGKMLGTADLLGQMADRTYLEKLPLLFSEFKEAGVAGYKSEFDLLRKTLDFYAMARKRLILDLCGVYKNMRFHFRARWNVDKNLYMEAIEDHMKYLAFLMKYHSGDYHQHLKRKISGKKIQQKANEC